MSKYKIGQILEVRAGTRIHYERVIQIESEVLTETMQETQNEDTCIQGLCENWKYRIVSDVEITSALRKRQERR